MPGESTGNTSATVALHNKGELDQVELIYRNVLAVEVDTSMR